MRDIAGIKSFDALPRWSPFEWTGLIGEQNSAFDRTWLLIQYTLPLAQTGCWFATGQLTQSFWLILPAIHFIAWRIRKWCSCHFLRLFVLAWASSCFSYLPLTCKNKLLHAFCEQKFGTKRCCGVCSKKLELNYIMLAEIISNNREIRARKFMISEALRLYMKVITFPAVN